MSIHSCGLGKEDGGAPNSIATARRQSQLLTPSHKPVIRHMPLAVTIETTKRLTSLGNTTIWKLIKEKKLRTARVGARTLIIYESIEELLGIATVTEDDEAE
jgi:hypothetical protein